MLHKTKYGGSYIHSSSGHPSFSFYIDDGCLVQICCHYPLMGSAMILRITKTSKSSIKLSTSKFILDICLSHIFMIDIIPMPGNTRIILALLMPQVLLLTAKFIINSNMTSNVKIQICEKQIWPHSSQTQ